jgi:uncharacterized protein YjbI with pentapeptide repeats
MNSIVLLVLGAAATVGGAGVFGAWLVRHRTRPAGALSGVILLSFGILVLVTGWLLGDGTINRGEALKTGGLAAGSVVALYALWLNDRRRRTEEKRQEIEAARHELETRRTDHDRERVADERFARAIELLGSAADQVRVGAMHALVGLSRSRPAYTQTVLDVLCAYLRRPFDYAERDERELQVRTTAQRLIADLLPLASDPNAPAYDLDLHGATLEYFDLRGRVVGQLRARKTQLYESTSFNRVVVRGPAWFTGSHCHGRFYAPEVVFHDRSWFSHFTADGEVDLTGAVFRGQTKFADSEFHGKVSFQNATFDHGVDFNNVRFANAIDLRLAGGAIGRTIAMRVSLEHEYQLPDGWIVDTSHGPTFGLVRA